MNGVPPSPPAIASTASKPAGGDPPHLLTHKLLRDLAKGIQDLIEYSKPPEPVEQQPALVIEISGTGTLTSPILRRERAVLIVETIGTGSGTVTILDQPHGGAPQPSADPAGVRQVSGHEKWLVAGVMDAFNAQLVVTSGSLGLLIGFADSGENIHDFGSKLYDWTLSAPATGGAASPLKASAFPCSSVYVQNDPSNNSGAAGAYDIYVGNSSSQSIRLRPGDGEVFRINDASSLYVICVGANTPRINCHAKP